MMANPLKKKAKRGYQGHPVATIAYYGPTDREASKVSVGIIKFEVGGVDVLRRWTVERGDARYDAKILAEVLEFLRQQKAKTVVLSPGIIGCPHEEGVDYPEGESCPACPFWEGRNRWTGELTHEA